MAGELVPADDLPGNLVPDTDLPDAQLKQPTPEGSTLSAIISMVKPAILPTIGGIVGGMAGAASPIPGGMLLGESAGSVLGVAGNQALGIESPSATDYGIAAAFPMAGRVVGSVLKNTVGGAIKAFAGRQATAEAAGGLMRGLFGPASPSGLLFNKMRAAKVSVPTDDIYESTFNILTKEAGQAKGAIRAEIESVIKPVHDLVSAKKLTSEVVETEINRLGAAASNAFNKGSVDVGRAASATRAAMLDALENVGIPEAKQAMAAFRREQGVKTLGEIASGSQPIRAFNDALANDSLFAKTFPATAEREEIRRILGRVSTATWSGFSGVVGRGAAGFGVGQVLGATAGIIAASAAPEMMANLAASKGGRALLTTLLKDPKPVINIGNFMAVGANFLRAQMASSPELDQTVKSALQDSNVPLKAKFEVLEERDALRRAVLNQ